MKPQLPLFFLLILLVTVPLANMEATPLSQNFGQVSFPTVANNDISILDIYRGTANESDPMYWGNHTYFYTGDWYFFAQKGGVHNHAYAHTVWDATPYITSVRNALFNPIENRVTVYRNQTLVTFSNGTTVTLENRLSPLTNSTMHAAEFSPQSRAIYWFEDETRLIVGEILH